MLLSSSQVRLQNCSRLRTLSSIAKISYRGFLFSRRLHKTEVFGFNGGCCSVGEVLCTGDYTGNFYGHSSTYVVKLNIFWSFSRVYLRKNILKELWSMELFLLSREFFRMVAWYLAKLASWECHCTSFSHYFFYSSFYLTGMGNQFCCLQKKPGL